MNVKDFDPAKLDFSSGIYHSKVYDLDFDLPWNCSLFVFDPLPKEEIAISLPPFLEKIPGQNYNSPYWDDVSFYTNQNTHQLYRFLFKSDRESCITFRDLSNSKLENIFLEGLCEASAIRAQACEEPLNKKLEEFYGFGRATEISNEVIFHLMDEKLDPKERSLYMRVLNHRTSCILDSLRLMAQSGYSISDLNKEVDLAKLIVYPLFGANDSILKTTFDSLKNKTF